MIVREFLREPQWNTARARDVWAPRIGAISAAWMRVERDSVARGKRPSALLSLGGRELVDLSRFASASGLAIAVLGEALVSDTYSNADVPTAGSRYQGIRAALTRPELTPRWHEAWATRDAIRIGELLGFPPCCAEFFKRTWQEARKSDTTPWMGEGNLVNILLRWLGVRLVPHLPCSFGCERSAEFTESLSDLWPATELAWAREMLSWRMEYTSLHGAGVVTTPLFNFAFSTDYLPKKFSLLWSGKAAPTVAPEDDEVETTEWQDNGFSSAATMDAAHGPIIDVVGAVRSCIDLGCGDGTLLAKIKARSSSEVDDLRGGLPNLWVGVEGDAQRARRGMRRHPDVQLFDRKIEEVVRFAWDERAVWDVGVIMPGRLLEMGAEDAEATRRFLGLCRRLVVYLYRDRSMPFDLLALCDRAGLRGDLLALQSNDVVQAAELLRE